MKPTAIFNLGLIATLALMFFDDILQDDAAAAGEGMSQAPRIGMCIAFGALLQLYTLANSGAKKLRLVSGLWMLVALVLSSAESLEFFPLFWLFFAGVAFSFLPAEKPTAQSD